MQRKVPSWIAAIVVVAIAATVVLRARGLYTGWRQYRELQTSKAKLTQLAAQRAISRTR